MLPHGEEPTSPPPLPRNVRVLGWASLINDVASEMVYPLLPLYLMTVLGGNRFHLGIMEGIADAVASLLKLGSGRWSDRLAGRKTFVVAGYLLAAVARPLAGIALLPWHLLITRLLDRVGKGLRTAPRDALIADSTTPAGRGAAFGFHRAMDHLGAALGPSLAALFLWLRPGEFRLLFALTLLPGLLVVVLLWIGLHEPAQKRAELSGRKAENSLRFGRSFWCYLLVVVVFTLGNSSDAFLLVRAEELGMPAAQLPMLWCAFHVVKSLGNLWSGRAVDRWGPRPLIVGGWLVYAGIYLVFALLSAAWQVWPVFLAYGLFHALTEPAEKTFVALLVPEALRGSAYGWFHGALGIAILPANLIFGAIYQQAGALAAFGWGATLAVVATVMLCWLLPSKPQATFTKSL